MTDPRLDAKRRAAHEAADLVRSGMVVGLGTGSTAALFVEELGRRLREGELSDIVGVPTSKTTHQQATLVGLPLGMPDEFPEIDLTVDGADEVDPAGNLIKGLGGALLREKIVAFASRRLVIVADESKRVDRLGLKAPLPVEVVQFGARSHYGFFHELGAKPEARLDRDGTIFVSDEGHYIVDLKFPSGLPNPGQLQAMLRGRPGIVETGLFLGFRPTVIWGRAEA